MNNMNNIEQHLKTRKKQKLQCHILYQKCCGAQNSQHLKINAESQLAQDLRSFQFASGDSPAPTSLSSIHGMFLKQTTFPVSLIDCTALPEICASLPLTYRPYLSPSCLALTGQKFKNDQKVWIFHIQTSLPGTWIVLDVCRICRSQADAVGVTQLVPYEIHRCLAAQDVPNAVAGQ